ncbi:hypothetical protein DY000_02022868 [Brassica cretica]|uniref:Uncharacterized protein n=1 Tax=Brassica cretica TaxID=69181 RepID=A0ABQ7E6R5_BRACR|nr:hypothetical protein DY000_02022868 [Brassica cretica]
MKNMDKVHKANIMDLNIKHLKFKENTFKEIMFNDNYFKVKINCHQMTNKIFLSTIITLNELPKF